MKSFRVVPLETAVTEKIRSTMKDDYGHDLTAKALQGRALCRYCLSDGGSEQRHILFSYMPVKEDKNPYSEVGPIYVHDRCEQYRDLSVLPPDLGKRKYLTVRGYSADQLLVAGEMSEGYSVEQAIVAMFENPAVAYLHISDASTGCYFLKIARE